MKIGIIAAMEEELSLLLANLLDAQEHQVLSKTYYTGRFGKHELILVQSGVGKVMSAMTVAILVEHFKAQAIIKYRISRGSRFTFSDWRCGGCRSVSVS
ncbi:MTA/SAH nucleosidase [Streptococcus pyogenes]|nr:MTA/SAH nucleosidase [Streptococcus pyogenes]